jgi:FlaG/FlaF family flagellin (archaellin)
MNWRQRQKEEYSFYVTGAVILIAIVLVMAALVQQVFFK